jgi:hypothetical protein
MLTPNTPLSGSEAELKPMGRWCDDTGRGVGRPKTVRWQGGLRRSVRRTRRGPVSLFLHDRSHWRVVSAVAMCFGVATPATAAVVQLPGRAGCVGSVMAGCASARGITSGGALELSGDGRFVYAGSEGSIAIFRRDGRTGALRQLRGSAGCLVANSRSGCGHVRGLSGTVISFVLTSSPERVYVLAQHGLAVFVRRQRTGVLHQVPGRAGCVSFHTREHCLVVRRIGGDEFTSFALAPDAGNAYIASDFGLGVLAVDHATGGLRQLRGAAGCLRSDARHGCGVAHGFGGYPQFVVGPEGRSLYVTSNSGVAIFTRAPESGALTQPSALSCVEEDASDGCTVGHGLHFGPMTTLLSHDHRTVYWLSYTDVCSDGVTACSSLAIAAFSRDPSTGALTQVGGPGGCIDPYDGACRRMTLDGEFRAAVLSQDGRNLYAGASLSGFAVDPTTGSLTPLAAPAVCSRVTLAGCPRGNASLGAEVAISPSGDAVYAADAMRGQIGAFGRSAGTGALMSSSRRDTCLKQPPSIQCRAARGLNGVNIIRLSPDGRFLYARSLLSDYARGGPIVIAASR